MEVDLFDEYSFYEAPDYSISYGSHHYDDYSEFVVESKPWKCMLLIFGYMRAVLGAKYSADYIVFLQYFVNKYITLES